MPRIPLRLGLVFAGVVLLLPAALAQSTRAVDERLAAYFRAETENLATNAFAGMETRADWDGRRDARRRELLDMLGLWPMPERTDLRPTVTGTIERDDFVVEKLHFQSLPGLYVTANLYRPREQSGPLPGVLYVCGHAQVKTNGVSCGNKTGYQHHGIWFARHGYVCLLIDTLQLGEIEGVHHGTHRMNQWWWNSRGYSPAGVEAWNGVRALDYLVSRPEVDPTRLGMTGRSGGGSYTWTTAAIDDRVRVAAPVAGITDLENQVVDGAVEGHCDCMFFVNTHRWDFGLNAALMAPRPLLIVNTDNDSIFPLDGVLRVHAQAKRIYELQGVSTNLGLVIGPGGHADTQDLQVPVLRWFNRHLKGADPLIESAAVKLFPPLELRVFKDLPTDQRNTQAAEWFGVPTPAATPTTSDPLALTARLLYRSFRGWPDAVAPGSPPPPASKPAVVRRDQRRDGWRVQTWEFESQPLVRLQLDLITQGERAPARVAVCVLDETGWKQWQAQDTASWIAATGRHVDEAQAVAVFAPRGIGANAWGGDERKQIQIRRRFMLLGQTLDGMRVWDIRRAVQTVGGLFPGRTRIAVEGEGAMAVNALYAALFEPGVRAAKVAALPVSLREGGPDYLNALQVLDIPGARELLEARGVDLHIRQ